VAAFGDVHGAFNNAGIGGPDGPIALHSEDGWARVIAVNLTGVFLCLKHELALFQSRTGGGSIVNTSSLGGLIAVPTQAAYSASKHGVLGLTKTAAAEYGHIGVRVNAVCPGIVATAGTKALIPEEVRATLLDSIPVKRMAEPAEVAAAVAYLLSDEASYLTGVALPVDGGHLAL
jgi:NAD(P)-dependent dehydrogenase (short-subunit alcohol dehydrogenase family)